ncbi:MAG: glycosyltransferase [Planktomarina sp.]
MPKIAIVMAVFHPDTGFLREQIQSLVAQTFQDWDLHIVVADLVSKDLIKTLTHDINNQVHLIEPDTTLDPVKAFEAGLTAALSSEAEFFACCDQDDIWHPEKLSKCITALQRSNAGLVHCDARIVDAAGTPVAKSLFRKERRQTAPRLPDLLYRNIVTGMTAIVTRDVMTQAIPFPKQDGVHYYHDLWLALVARASAPLAFVDEALVCYRQHDQNVVGAKLHRGGKAFRARVSEYALARYLAEVLAHRFGPSPETSAFLKSNSKGGVHLSHALRFFCTIHFVQSYIAFWFAIMPVARRIWAIRQTMHVGYTQALQNFDDRLFALSPGLHPPEQTLVPQPQKTRSWWTYKDGRMAPKFTSTADRAHPRTVIFVPTLNPAEAFAGVATAIDLGLGLAERGHKITFIATDLQVANPTATRQFMTKRNPIAMHSRNVEIACGVTTSHIAFHRADQLIATAWWTAHVAHQIRSEIGIFDPFTYLIQDYEPCFYPWGTEYSYARASYDLPHWPVFNSTPLKDYFHSLNICSPHALSFQPAVDAMLYKPIKQAPPHKRTIAIYGRPEVARNVFPLKISALGTWLEVNQITAREVEILSIGQKHPDIELPGGITLKSLGKLPWADYPDFLRRVDVGLSLMCSPHPSHPPLEMAAAGAQVVTNAFGPKTLSQISSNIHTSDLSVPSIMQALDTAWAKVGEHDRLIDLSPLGPTFDEMLNQLSANMTHGVIAA